MDTSKDSDFLAYEYEYWDLSMPDLTGIGHALVIEFVLLLTSIVFRFS